MRFYTVQKCWSALLSFSRLCKSGNSFLAIPIAHIHFLVCAIDGDHFLACIICLLHGFAMAWVGIYTSVLEEISRPYKRVSLVHFLMCFWMRERTGSRKGVHFVCFRKCRYYG